jgi:hypothetical protein
VVRRFHNTPCSEQFIISTMQIVNMIGGIRNPPHHWSYTAPWLNYSSLLYASLPFSCARFSIAVRSLLLTDLHFVIQFGRHKVKQKDRIIVYKFEV